jgi:hypothetical protein
MSQAFVRSLLVVAPALITATNVLAHDSWINRGAFKNAAGRMVLRRLRLQELHTRKIYNDRLDD